MIPNDAFLANLAGPAAAYLAPQATMPPPDPAQMARLQEFAAAQAPAAVAPPTGVHETPAWMAPQSADVTSRPLTPIAAAPPMTAPAPPANAPVQGPIAHVSSGEHPGPRSPSAGPDSPMLGGYAPPHSPVVAVSSGGTPSHEALVAGPTQTGLYNQALGERQAGVQAESEGQKQASLNAAIAASVARDDALAREHGAQQARAEQQKQLDAKRARLDAAAQELDANKPTDFWSDRSTGNRVGIAIATALVAGGQTLAGGNPALGHQMLQSMIDDDMRTKQARYGVARDKKDVAQGQFDNLAHQIGMEPAKDMWQAAVKDKMAAAAEIQAQSAKLPLIQANAEKMASNLRAEADEHRANAFIKWVPAQGGGTKYMVDGIPIAVSGDKAFAHLAANQMTDRKQYGDERVEVIKQAGKAGEKKDQGTKFIAEKLQTADIPGALTALNKADSFLYDDPKSGRKAVTAGIDIASNRAWSAEGLKGEVARAAYRRIHGEDAVKREQAWDGAVDLALKALTGAGKSEKEVASMKKQALGAGDVESRREWVRDMTQRISSAKENIYAGAGPEAAADYESNKAALKPKAIKEEAIR